jgi:SulP family sulfate permease
MIVAGLLRLGTYVKYIPFPVTVGFTAGIAVIILVTQLRDLLGLHLTSDPAETVPKAVAVWQALGTISLPTVALSAGSIAIIALLRRYRPEWPALLIAVLVAAALTFGLQLDIETIGTRFGAIASGIPAPALPTLSWAKFVAVFPDAVAIALLGAIESLLSAVVADGMTGRRHRSNSELVAQGIGNVAASAFGGMPVTGTIARTATNIRAGARGPVAGMFHALYLLVFVLVAMPLVAYIPLSALAAVLAVVAWSMADKSDFIMLLRHSRADALILLATFLLVIFFDLLTGIAAGVVLGSFVFLHRMAEAVEIDGGPKLVREDVADRENGRAIYEGQLPGDVMVYRISGAFFFGATARLRARLLRRSLRGHQRSSGTGALRASPAEGEHRGLLRGPPAASAAVVRVACAQRLVGALCRKCRAGAASYRRAALEKTLRIDVDRDLQAARDLRSRRKPVAQITR